VGTWWLLFLLGNLLRILASRVTASGDVLSALQQSAQLEVIGFGSGIVASLLAIAVVLRLTARQDAKASFFAGVANSPRTPGWPFAVAGAKRRGANLDTPGRGPDV
jgi:hypothetical protein